MTRQAVWERLKTNGIELRTKKVLPYVIYDDIKFTPSGNGYYRATHRYEHTSLHRYKYQKEVKPIPDDWDVHHIDGNKLNNKIENLQALPKSEHTKLHQHDKNI